MAEDAYRNRGVVHLAAVVRICTDEAEPAGQREIQDVESAFGP